MIQTNLKLPLEHELLEDLRNGHYAFIDASSAGCGALAFCERRFKRGPGLAIVHGRATSSDMHTFANVSAMPLPHKCVSFCSLIDFVERLPHIKVAIEMIKVFADSAKDFLFIRYPSFEDSQYLARYDLKLCWQDWPTYTNHIKLQQFEDIFLSLGLEDFTIIPRMQMIDSTAQVLVPITASPESLHYSAREHGPKRKLVFRKQVFGQFDIFVKLNPEMPEQEWKAILSDSIEPIKPQPSFAKLAWAKMKYLLNRNLEEAQSIVLF